MVKFMIAHHTFGFETVEDGDTVWCHPLYTWRGQVDPRHTFK